MNLMNYIQEISLVGTKGKTMRDAMLLVIEIFNQQKQSEELKVIE
jgi:hypothetical protein